MNLASLRGLNYIWVSCYFCLLVAPKSDGEVANGGESDLKELDIPNYYLGKLGCEPYIPPPG